MAYASWSVVFGEQPSAAKWNILGTNDASFNDGTGIGVAAISKPEQLVTGAGTSWAWQSWTPTFANITVGNGTLSCSYVQIGKTIYFRISLTLGTTSSIGTSPTATLPVTAIASIGGGVPFGPSSHFDTSASQFFSGYVKTNTTTTMTFLLHVVVGGAATYIRNDGVTATTPFTWATGDILSASGMYEAA